MKPRPDVLAFLADCKENPADDTPRLVLSDWLEERGDERGEFVRLQVRGGDAREKELLERHAPEWLGVLAEKNIRTEFRRGLVKARGTTRKLLTKRLAAMPAAEAFAWVDQLAITDLDAEGLPALAASPHWMLLSELNIGRMSYYADHLTQPERVGKSRGDWSALATLTLLGRLTRLDLGRQDIGVAGAAALAPAGLSRLRELDLCCNNLGDEGAAALVASRSLTGLLKLDLRQNRMRADGFAALAAWRGLAGVERLRLADNYPGAAGIAALAASRWLGRVTELWLSGEDFPLPELFGPHAFGPEGAASLAASKGLRGLVSLRMSGNRIGPSGAEALAASKAFPALKELDLSENGIGDAGAVALARSPALRGLARLDLRHNGIGDVGTEALANSPYMLGLISFNFRANWGASSASLARLRARFGDVVDFIDPSGRPR